MKYVVIPNNINDIDKYSNIDTFIIGLKDYSINYPTASLEEIKELSLKYNIFVSINKNIFNNELADLLGKLKELAKLNIKGILYYDLGVLNLVKDNNLSLDLVWHQTHMVTNYNTCNFYLEQGVKYGFIANEVTLSEIIEINKNTNMELFVSVIGYPIVSHSRRSLLTNYFKSISKDKEDKIYNISENNTLLKIKETKDGTSILNGYITNGTKALFDLIANKISYLVLDMQDINLDIALKIIDKYNYILNNIDNIDLTEKENIISYIDALIGSNTNFFYKKTIYKIRGDKNA